MDYIYENVLSRLYTVYINGDIEGPEQYHDLFEVLRTASPDDVVDISINSGGGDLYTALQICDSIEKCQAYVSCRTQGTAMSAGAMILLAGDAVFCSPNSALMFHDGSKQMKGKFNENKRQSDFDIGWYRGMHEKLFSHVLTKEEIEGILEGRDLYMTGQELMDRAVAAAELQTPDPDLH